jgi:hypothetical protein
MLLKARRKRVRSKHTSAGGASITSSVSSDVLLSAEGGAATATSVQPQAFRVILVQTVNRCRSACAAINRESLIVLDCEGVQLSRDGRLCLLQIATHSNNTVYLFDIVAGGQALFQNGLKEVCAGVCAIRVGIALNRRPLRSRTFCRFLRASRSRRSCTTAAKTQTHSQLSSKARLPLAVQHTTGV